MTKLSKPTCKPIYSRKKINKLFAGLGSVRIVKNCELGLENAALACGLGQHFQDLSYNGTRDWLKVEWRDQSCMKLDAK